jgi:hypothetical protein
MPPTIAAISTAETSWMIRIFVDRLLRSGRRFDAVLAIWTILLDLIWRSVSAAVVEWSPLRRAMPKRRKA